MRYVLGELRWQTETAALLIDPVWRGVGVPRGNGEAIVVVPGFMTGDRSTLLLRRWLRRVGYVPYTAHMTFNADCSRRALDALEKRVEQIAGKHGGERLTIVGHSRGGILGKALGAARPDLLKRVVTLGSGLNDGYDINLPLRIGIAGMRRWHTLTTDRVARHGCMTQECACSFGLAARAAFPDDVELVSVYTREDGFSHWRSSHVDYAHNVELTGSHLGLVANRFAFRAVGLSLAGRAGEVAL